MLYLNGFELGPGFNWGTMYIQVSMQMYKIQVSKNACKAS